MGLLSWLFADKYAKRLMATPGFVSKLDAANEKLGELKRLRESWVDPENPMNVEFANSPNVKHCQAAIRECDGDEDKGYRLFHDRYTMMETYGVTWEVASHTLKPGDPKSSHIRDLQVKEIYKRAENLSPELREGFIKANIDMIDGKD
jgi:hypothetical protein